MERAEILLATRDKYGELPRPARQAAILRDLCEGITPVIEPEDIVVGRMPEVVPTEEQEWLIAEHPEVFSEQGVPEWLDSMSIFVPEWRWLLERGVGGLAAYASEQQEAGDLAGEEREFLAAASDAMESLSLLIRRYAHEARRQALVETAAERRAELHGIAARCQRVAWDPPEGLVDALHLLQLVHMVLSCLVGARDVTPGRIDQYLLDLYRRDIARGTLRREDAVVLLAMFFLRLSQMAGSGTDFDDNVRRTPCKYTHLYVTVGGSDAAGGSCVNELSFVVADAIRLLDYKEPTLLVRWHGGMDREFALKVAELVKDRLPVTIYNDGTVIKALVRQDVPLVAAHEYAHSACHNSIVPGREAGSGPGGFHNVPKLIVLAMNAGRDPASGKQVGAASAAPDAMGGFDDFLRALREQVQHTLANARANSERRWREQLADACPLLSSCLLRLSMEQRRPAWQAAGVSHLNHYFLGLATAVDSLLAIQQIVFGERLLTLAEFVDVLRGDWRGHEVLRGRIRRRLPRSGQDRREACEMASRVARLWVEEVVAASAGMERLCMWPGFYSHMHHVWQGAATTATPDGRKSGDPLSENLAPSMGTPGCSPTAMLRAMLDLPLDHTPSGAAILTLSRSDVAGDDGAGRLLSLMESYFSRGGLHLHVNTVDAATLKAAMDTPGDYPELMVRVAGFSAYFTQLSRRVQLDVLRRHEPMSHQA